MNESQKLLIFKISKQNSNNGDKKGLDIDEILEMKEGNLPKLPGYMDFK